MYFNGPRRVWTTLILLFIIFSRWAPNDLDGRVWKSYSLGLFEFFLVYLLSRVFSRVIV
jgi:hypothetical protein